MLGPARRIRHRRDRSTLVALRRAGISGDLIERLFRPFLAGVFLEDELETSSRFFHLVWRSMLRGSLCLPRHGIRAVPEQLAAALPPGTIRLQTPVAELTQEGSCSPTEANVRRTRWSSRPARPSPPACCLA
jgi:phytoene dehydrogenase-like protein